MPTSNKADSSGVEVPTLKVPATLEVAVPLTVKTPPVLMLVLIVVAALTATATKRTDKKEERMIEMDFWVIQDYYTSYERTQQMGADKTPEGHG